jgi:nuclear RNA export factor
MKGDSVIITASPEDIAQIQKLNNFTFAGTSLLIHACEPPSPLAAKSAEKKEYGPSPSVQETKDRIQAILAGRYDPRLKLLNLSALGHDHDLVQMGMFEENKTSTKLFPALMAVCDGLFKTRQEKADAIDSVSLADNELVDLTMVFKLAQTFPDLKNLDLSRNKFSDLKSLDSWRTKFRHLERLLLKDNPIETLSPAYNTEIIKWFPTLRFLNDTQVRTPEEIAATTAAAKAAKSPIPITGPDFRDVAQVGENFARQFISLYDSDRTALLANFYDAQSIHSISVNMSAPRNPEHSTAILPWAEYTKHSRNLVKITHIGPRMSRRYRGVQEIQPVWSNLPVTRHPDLQTQADKYLIECHPLPGLSDPTGQSARGVDGLILTMHGEFEEKPNSTTEKALRSFSRTFVLGPGAPGGPPIRVVSDMMVLRAWGPLASPINVANPPAKINMGNQEQQQQQESLTMQLVGKTGMTPNYAMLCLTETGWDLEKAFVAFSANKVCI